MELILTSVSEDLTAAWHRFCGGFAFVRIHDGSILDVDCDAVVSPANSFGFMTEGLTISIDDTSASISRVACRA